MSKKRIFIVNAQPGGNKGAEAMLEIVIQKLRSFASTDGYTIWIEALNAAPVYAAFCDRIGLDQNIFQFNPRNLGAPYSVRPARGDIMIDIGGINYTENSVLANLRNFRRHNFFRCHGVRMIFFTQDFGPVTRTLTKIIARRIMGAAHTVFSRSAQSLENLKKTVPKVSAIGPFPDCTLALTKVLPPQMPAHPFVVLVPSAIMVNQYGVTYLNFMLEIGKALPSDMHAIVLAHNFTANGIQTDTQVCKDLHARLVSYREVTLMIGQRPPAELKGLLSGAEAVITSRFHAMVGAMACNVPAYSIGWNPKYESFMALYQLEELSINIERLSEPSLDMAVLAREVCNQALNAVEKSQLSQRNADLSAQVNASFMALEAAISA